MLNKKAPVCPSTAKVAPPELTEISLTGGFWGTLQDLNRAAIIPHALEWMNKLGWIQNFVDAGSQDPYEVRGWQFADSEIYKLIEAMAWDNVRTGGDVHLDTIAKLTDFIAGAQDPDGYLHTGFGRQFQEPRYKDMKFGHELYCAGHFLQSAVAVARTGVNEDYVKIATKVADHVVRMFNKGGYNRICGHSCIELGLVEFYRLTGEKSYLDQAALFVERHGEGTLPSHEFGRAYWQDHEKVRDSEVLSGHAVRALYLAAAAVDVAVENEDDELLSALETQWANTVAKRTYITGGMGSHHMDEAFGEDYVLPNDRSYCETCAGVASIMFSWRLFLTTGNKKYNDLIERTLYNVIAVSPSEEGNAFFYANTLHQRVDHAEPAFNKEGVVIRGGAAGRQPWFEVSCCPPNLARLLASLGGYAFSTSETAVDLHQYLSSTIDTTVAGERVQLVVDTDLPKTGHVSVQVTNAPAEGVLLRLRVPYWVTEPFTVRHGEQDQVVEGLEVYELRVLTGDEVTVDFPMSAQFIRADDRVDANRGCIAVQRGPVIYALESVDLPAECLLEDTYVDSTISPIERDGQVIVMASTVTRSQPSSPLGIAPVQGVSEAKEVALVPYHGWARRGASTMRIWIPQVQAL